MSCFLGRGESSLRASGERRGLRRGHRGALQHVGAGPVRVPGSRSFRARGGCLSWARPPRAAQVPFSRTPPSPPPFPTPSLKLDLSGNDDSGRIIQAPAFLYSRSASLSLVISQLLSACPGTSWELEANQGNLKLTSVVWCGNTHNTGDPNRVYVEMQCT